jgi:site-specific recombinase XerD
MTQLAPFDARQLTHIQYELQRAYVSLTQQTLPYAQRSLTAKNYAVAIDQYRAFATQHHQPLPDADALTAWRDAMQAHYAPATVNLKLSAMRQLLNQTARNIPDANLKLILRDWATIKGVRQPRSQDKGEGDYGYRLTLPQVKAWLGDIETETLKGLRDKAILATLVYTGLRISELQSLTVRDLFLTDTQDGLRACRVRSGKGDKSRLVVYPSYDPLFLRWVRDYLDAIDLHDLDAAVFYGTVNRKGVIYTTATPLKIRALQKVIASYPAPYGKQHKPTQIAAHDLRRTYAKLCRDAGMAWDALQLQLGHADIQTTQRYVGLAIDNSERQPKWE